MFRNVAIGQYYPVASPMHRLDARAKLLAVLAYIVALFLVKPLAGYAVAIFALGAVIFASRVPWRFLARGLRGILFIIIFTAALNVFLTPGETVLFHWAVFTITAEGALIAFKMTLRLALLVVASSILTLTTTPTQLTDAIESLLKPLKRVKAPVHEVAMMMTIALRFIPTLMEEMDKLMKAQTARGADFDTGGLVKKAKALVPLLVPLFLSAIRRAEDLAIAMEARCYRGDINRTKLKQMRYAARDFIFFGLVAAFCASVLGVNALFAQAAPAPPAAVVLQYAPSAVGYSDLWTFPNGIPARIVEYRNGKPRVILDEVYTTGRAVADGYCVYVSLKGEDGAFRVHLVPLNGGAAACVVDGGYEGAYVVGETDGYVVCRQGGRYLACFSKDGGGMYCPDLAAPAEPLWVDPFAGFDAEREVGSVWVEGDYVYFSYGGFGGSGDFWQGGSIFRVKIDTEDCELVAEDVDDPYDYAPRHEPPVTADEARRLGLADSAGYRDETLYGDALYFNVIDTEDDPANAIGWRDARKITLAAGYSVNLKTREITELYRYGAY